MMQWIIFPHQTVTYGVFSMSNQLGKTIRILRQAKGLSVTELAHGAEVSVPFVTLIEKGVREPSITVLRHIAAILGVSCDILVKAAFGVENSAPVLDGGSKEISETVDRLVVIEAKLRQLLTGKSKDVLDGYRQDRRRQNR